MSCRGVFARSAAGRRIRENRETCGAGKCGLPGPTEHPKFKSSTQIVNGIIPSKMNKSSHLSKMVRLGCSAGWQAAPVAAVCVVAIDVRRAFSTEGILGITMDLTLARLDGRMPRTERFCALSRFGLYRLSGSEGLRHAAGWRRIPGPRARPGGMQGACAKNRRQGQEG